MGTNAVFALIADGLVVLPLHPDNLKVYAADLSASGWLAARTIPVLFCCQQRSDRGFMTMTDGVNFLHRKQKVVYAIG